MSRHQAPCPRDRLDMVGDEAAVVAAPDGAATASVHLRGNGRTEFVLSRRAGRRGEYVTQTIFAATTAATIGVQQITFDDAGRFVAFVSDHDPRPGASGNAGANSASSDLYLFDSRSGVTHKLLHGGVADDTRWICGARLSGDGRSVSFSTATRRSIAGGDGVRDAHRLSNPCWATA